MTDDDADFNRHKAVQTLEAVPLTDDRHEARRQALDHLNAVPIGVLEEFIGEMLSNQDGLEMIGTDASLAAMNERRRWANRLQNEIDDYRSETDD